MKYLPLFFTLSQNSNHRSFSCIFSFIQWYFISHNFYRSLQMVALKKPAAVWLSVLMGVGPWGWNISASVGIGIVVTPLWCSVPASISAANVKMFFNVTHSVRMGRCLWRRIRKKLRGGGCYWGRSIHPHGFWYWGGSVIRRPSQRVTIYH